MALATSFLGPRVSPDFKGNEMVFLVVALRAIGNTVLVKSLHLEFVGSCSEGAEAVR
jgi:hypothetical protein